jgi:hypothetical protein
MQNEIERWRALATLQEHHHPDEKIEMVRTKRHLKKLPSRVDNNFKSQPKTLRSTAKARKLEFSKLLEEISEKQSDGIQRLLAGGDLNISTANALIKDNNFESVVPTRAGSSYPSTAPSRTKNKGTAQTENTDGELDKTDMEVCIVSLFFSFIEVLIIERKTSTMGNRPIFMSY